MEKIKVLYISPAYFPNMLGGSERSVKMLAEGIAKDERFECYVLAFDGENKKPQYEEYNNVKVIRVKKLNFSPNTLAQNISLLYYRKIVENLKPNIIHVYNTYHIPSSYFFKKICPVVATLNNYFAVHPLSYTPDNIMEKKKMNFMDIFKGIFKSIDGNIIKKMFISSMYLVYWIIIKNLSKRINLYIPISKTTGNIHILQGIPKEKVIPVYNISDDKIRKKDVSNVKRKKSQILYVGGLLSSKGVFEMIKSYEKIDNKDVTLHIVGGGILYNDIKKYIEDRKLNVILHGKLPHDKLQKFYRESAFIIHPSLWPDPLPRVILEILHYDIPVISADNPVAKEVFGKGVTYFKRGDLNDLTQKINLMIDGKLKCNLDYGRKIVFGIDPIEKIRSIYLKLLNKNKYRY